MMRQRDARQRAAVSALALAAALLGTAAPVAAQPFLKKDAAAWAKELRGPSEAGRRNAAFALGKMGSTAYDSVPALCTALAKDESPKVREAAAFALGEIARESIKAAAEPQLIPTLTAALKDEHWVVRRSAAFALGCIEKDAAPAQEALEGLLRDGFPEVRQNAAWALGKLGNGTIPKLRQALRDTDALVKRDAATSLGLLEPEPVRVALDDLINLSRDGDSTVRRAAVGVLIRIVGPEDAKAAEALRARLADADVETRRNAALALSNIGGKQGAPAVPVLVEALHRGDLELRRQAAAALRNLGPDAARAVPDLVQMLANTDDELRANAALALGGIGPAAEKAVPALVRLVADTQAKSKPRVDAAVALSQIGPVPAAVDAVPRVLAVLGDAKDDGEVRFRLVWALMVHNVNLRMLKGVYPTLEQVLGEKKTEDNRMLRHTAAFLLGILQRESASPAVLEALLDFLKDDRVQLYVGTQATVQAAGAETQAGKANVKEVGAGDGRTLAVRALGEIGVTRVKGRPEIVEQLQALARDSATIAELRKDCQALLKTVP